MRARPGAEGRWRTFSAFFPPRSLARSLIKLSPKSKSSSSSSSSMQDLQLDWRGQRRRIPRGQPEALVGTWMPTGNLESGAPLAASMGWSRTQSSPQPGTSPIHSLETFLLVEPQGQGRGFFVAPLFSPQSAPYHAQSSKCQ